MDKIIVDRISQAVETFNIARGAEDFYVFQNEKCYSEEIKLIKAIIGEDCNEGPLFDLFQNFPLAEYTLIADGNNFYMKPSNTSKDILLTATFNGNTLSTFQIYKSTDRDMFETITYTGGQDGKTISKEYYKKDSEGKAGLIATSTSYYDEQGIKVGGIANRYYGNYSVEQIITRSTENPLEYRADNTTRDLYNNPIDRQEGYYNCTTAERKSTIIEPRSFVELKFDGLIQNFDISISENAHLFPNKASASKQILATYGNDSYSSTGRGAK